MAEPRANFIVIDKDFKPKNAEDVFYKYKALIIDALRKNLIAKDKDQPGKLIQSINVDIQIQGSKISFELSMEDYWKFVDEGRKAGAKMPPQKPILDFIKVRGLKGNPKEIPKVKNKTIRKGLKQISKEKALKQVAFLIARGIKKHGIKPTHFYSDVINDELKQNLQRDLTIALKRDIELNIKEAFN